MAQATAEELGGVPMSPALQATLLRAREYAAGQAHREVALEHLLLALTEDDDAAAVMHSCRVDLGRLRNDVASYLGSLGDRAGAGQQPVIAAALTQILKYATLAAQQGRRPRIDGAIVLAAIVGDGKSMAASFLKVQGLTFEQAVRVLQQSIREGSRAPGTAPVPSPALAPAPAPSLSVLRETPADAGRLPSAPSTGAEDILAAARARVGSRGVARPAQLAPLDTPEAEYEPRSSDGTAAATEPFPMSTDAELAEASYPPTSAGSHATAPPELPPDALAMDAMPAWPEEPPPTPKSPFNPPPMPSSWTPAPAPPSNAAPPSPFPPARPPLPPLVPLGLTPPRGPAPHSGPPPTSNVASPPPWGPPSERRLSLQQQAPIAPPSTPRNGPPQPAPDSFAGPPQPRSPAIEPGQLTHSIPTRWTLGRARTVEIQIQRQPIGPVGGASRQAPQRDDVVTARAISVRLRPAKGRFGIDQPSIETQWDKASDGGRLAGEAAVWRFTVQPLALGAGELLLTVAARTVAANGMILETALPDQVIAVRTNHDWSRKLRFIGLLILVGIGSIALRELLAGFFGIDVVKALRALLRL